MQKRIFMSLGIIIVIFFVIIILIGCDICGNNNVDMKEECVGVIEIADGKQHSYIGWYDDNLQYKGRSKIKIPNITSTGCKSLRKDGFIYLVSGNTKNSSKSTVVSINLKDKSRYKAYNSSKYINDITADGDLYTTSCEYLGTNVSFIEKIVDKTQKKASLSIKDIVISKIYATGHRLYAIGFGYNEYKDSERVFSKLYVIDTDNMRVIKSIDVSDKVIDATDMMLVEDDLYIAARTKRNENGEEVENKSLISMNIKTYCWSNRYVGENIGQFVGCNRISSLNRNTEPKESKSNNRNDGQDAYYIMFTNYDAVLDEGNIIYSFNLDTGHLSKKEVPNIVRDTWIRGKCIYVMGDKEIRKYCYKDYDNMFKLSKCSDDCKENNNDYFVRKNKLKNNFSNRISRFTCFLRN